jgi:hypothetical protein
MGDWTELGYWLNVWRWSAVAVIQLSRAASERLGQGSCPKYRAATQQASNLPDYLQPDFPAPKRGMNSERLCVGLWVREWAAPGRTGWVVGFRQRQCERLPLVKWSQGSRPELSHPNLIQGKPSRPLRLLAGCETKTRSTGFRHRRGRYPPRWIQLCLF